MGMCFEEFLVFFGCLLFCGERLKESLGLLQGVRVLLLWQGVEKGAAKEILTKFIVGGAIVCVVEGRSPPQKRKLIFREFDDTRGFPGEDISNK